jgi:triphosphoribosyl-dephospho-CoA synthase
MNMEKDYVARSAQLAMLLEVSAYPKPGNVDRTHDFADTRYEHFLASSVAIYPILRKAASTKKGMGKLIRRAVEESVAWQKGGNTHFGTILLLIPLAMAAGNSDEYREIKQMAKQIVLNSDVEDAVELYRAFPKAKVKLRRVPKLDVFDAASLIEIRQKNRTLYDILTISAPYDLISRELVGGWEKSFFYVGLLKHFSEDKNEGISINDAIVRSYLTLLSEEEDTFVMCRKR